MDKKSGKQVRKIACSEYWKGKDSYKKLQDNFYNYMIESGFDLERGNSRENEHIPIEKLKVITNYELQELSKESTKIEEEVITNNIEELRLDYKRVIKKINTISKRYTRIKNIVEETLFKSEQLKNENIRLKEEKNNLERETKDLKDFIEKTFECVHLLFNFPIDNLKRIVKDFYKSMKGKNK